MLAKKLSRWSAASMIAALSLVSSANAAITSIGFGEVAVANHASLTGSNPFAALGISFTGSAEYLVDSRMVGAGGDDKGITTGPSDPVMGIVFAVPATSVSFSGLSVNTDFYATVFDSSGNELSSVFFPRIIGVSENYLGHTFSDVGEISKIEFHDNNLFIGVGTLSFNSVPEPTTLSLLGLGAVSLLRRARRR